MLGCTYGNLFKVTVAGGSYQEGLSINMQGVPRVFISRRKRYMWN